MTDQTENMSDEELRRTVAELCGWKHEPKMLRPWVNPAMIAHAKTLPQKGAHVGSRVNLPDYVGSLDAMHEAEKMLSDEQHDRFKDALLAGIDPKAHLSDAFIYRYFVSATAKQRAIAFVKTMRPQEVAKP